MLLLIESLAAEILTLSPELVLLFGTPALPRGRPRRLLTIRQGREAVLVEQSGQAIRPI